MADGNVTITTADAFIPDLWSKSIIYSTINESVVPPLVTLKYSAEIKAMGDTIKIPNFSAVAVTDKVAGTAVTYTNETEATIDIVINKHKVFAFRVDDIAEIQSSPDLISGYSIQGARGIAKQMDVDITLLGASFSNAVGDQTSATAAWTDITDALIRDAKQLLDEAEAPQNDRFLVISPEQENAMLGIDKFVLANESGSDGALRTGHFGRIYGIDVYTSNNIADVAAVSGAAEAHKACFMFQREALALAIQLDPRVQAAYDIDYLATSVVGDVIYGVKELRDDYGVLIRTTDES